MTYRAAPITQRDGSDLASSNCRMASIATGLDYHTQGAKTSTGSRMRAEQDDQSGGTGSDDAKVAWSRGYSESLDIEDGETWASVLDALEGGRLVHLDVWAATVGGPCLSGSGAYGHTIAVAPEKSGTKWLVADPWCSPAKWVWWEESRLRSGAEEWGRRVLSTATGGLPPVGSAEWRVRVAVLAKVLMSRWNPDHPAPDPGDSPDTGGAQSVLFTVTAAHEDDDMPTLYSVGAVYRTLPVGTRVFDKPGGSQVGSISNASTVYRLTAKEAKGTPSWYLIDGGGVDGVMRWVYAGDLD